VASALSPSAQKMRGGYYTPADLAAFLVRWIRHGSPKTILEPSCGDGVFLRLVSEIIPSAAITGFELDQTEARKAASLGMGKVHHDDFLRWSAEALEGGQEPFDAVLGNPPFIRYQDLSPTFQHRAKRVFDALDCIFPGHANAWVPFLMASFALLRPGGRLAMVIPSEVLFISYAQLLRAHLLAHARRVVVIDPDDLWFDGTLQGSVMILLEKKRHPDEAADGVGMVPVRGKSFLQDDPEGIFQSARTINGDIISGRWLPAILPPSTVSLLDGLMASGKVHRFGDMAKTETGIVTGANSFFMVDEQTVERFGLQRWAHPALVKAGHCPGVIHDERQQEENAGRGKPTIFLWFRDRSVEESPHGKRYIRQGENCGFHLRYKCRIRDPWYAIYPVHAEKILLPRMIHHAPRLIFNPMRVYTSCANYHVRLQDPALEPERFVYGFLNALTALSAEMEGRYYGGGILEMGPSEMKKLLIPDLRMVQPALRELDQDVRTMPMDDVMEKQTQRILGHLTAADRAELLDGWKHLRDRRQRVSSKKQS
jgi:adenine-specific DNA methylase